MVHHMNDYPANTVIHDSTANNQDGAKKGGGEPAETKYAFGYGQKADGVDDYINLGTVPSSDTFTLSLLMPNKGTMTRGNIYARNLAANVYPPFGFYFRDSNLNVQSYIGDINAISTYAAVTNNDLYTIVADYPSVKVYKNGASSPTGDFTFTNHLDDHPEYTTQLFRMGADTTTVNYDDCALGEARLSSVVRSVA